MSSKFTYPVTMGRSGIQMIETLQVYDLVWGTTGINRFCGMPDRQVSVAIHNAHCFCLASLWQPENEMLKLFALVHDLPEAYYGDIHGDVKKLLGPDAKQVLDDIDDKIFTQLGLSRAARIALGSDLHRIDANALALEAEYAFDKFEPYHWPPADIYNKTDVLVDLIEGYDEVGIYNYTISTLDQLGNKNEHLQELLHRHRGYSHPSRNSYGESYRGSNR